MKRSGPSRVVNVTSSLYRLGRVPWDQLETAARGGANFEYPGVESTYASSKLLLNLFSVELARQLRGTGRANRRFCVYLHGLDYRGLSISPRKGARGPVHLASSPKLRNVSGKYFVSCRQSSWSRKVLDEETAHKVWCRSAELVRAVLEDVDNGIFEHAKTHRPQLLQWCSTRRATLGQLQDTATGVVPQLRVRPLDDWARSFADSQFYRARFAVVLPA
ncbi:hypothetical protein HPB51_003642 [Rhipicephalus microplus]|uniref:Uncharacterized protein n=1 Tax=Rhipicephalus microplus TaxID=6941 RepID=A0A9J6DZM1_RHIMP|nr:hypothetical protein HPB51_003642 [Rhipicephalus microplus]